jgi:hypothetical protein
MDAFNLCLQRIVHQPVLLDYREALERGACDRDRVKATTATLEQGTSRQIRLKAHRERIRTGDVRDLQLCGRELVLELGVYCRLPFRQARRRGRRREESRRYCRASEQRARRGRRSTEEGEHDGAVCKRAGPRLPESGPAPESSALGADGTRASASFVHDHHLALSACYRPAWRGPRPQGFCLL